MNNRYSRNAKIILLAALTIAAINTGLDFGILIGGMGQAWTWVALIASVITVGVFLYILIRDFGASDG